jgi:hypothetical protein
MATTYYTDIQKLYVAYFNRPADAAGLAYYEGVLEAAKGSATVMAQISADFAKSTEYTAAFSGKTSAEIVDIIYTNIFGHAADDAGRKFYADNLDAKKVTVANVVQEVAKGAQGTDLAAYSNKLTAAAAFSAAVDTDAEKTGYSGDAANKIAKAFLAGVTDNASLQAAIAPAALNTSVAKAVAAGTPFTVAGALASVNAANAAKAAFLVTADGDGDATTSAKDADVANALTSAQTKVEGLLAAGVQATYHNGSTAVKSALVADQIAANAQALNGKQTALVKANADVAAVAGLQAAINAQDAAETAQTNAIKAQTATAADLAAKEAAFEVTQGVTVTFAADGTAKYVKGTAAAADLIVLKDGALTLAVKEADFAGATALLNASIANEAADAAVTKAGLAVTAATNEVNHLDVSGTAESDALAAVAAKITTVDLKGAMPSEAQIATELATLDAKAKVEADPAGAAHTALTTFQDLVTTYHTAAAANPTVDAQDAAAAAVTAATKAISDFSKALTGLNTAQANVDQLAGYQATVDAAKALFTSNGFDMKLIDDAAVGTTQVAGAGSDVYVAGKNDANIVLFGLQGKDALSIGTGYTLNTGKLSAGNDAVKEVFILSANNGADTQIKLEKTAFGSHAATPEVITITLTGVAVADVHLNNGIITVGSTTV